MKWRPRPTRRGLINMVNLSYRNVAEIQEARERIASGEIGEVRHVEASYRQSWLVGNQWGDWRTDRQMAVAAFGKTRLQGRARRCGHPHPRFHRPCHAA